VNYTYDALGQLETALGLESGGTTNRWQEGFIYSYDAAGNLTKRVQNVQTNVFVVNSLNELTTVVRTNNSLTVAGTTTGGATSVTVADNGNSPVAAIRYADATFARTNVTLLNGTNTFTAVGQDSLNRTDSTSVTNYLPVAATFAYDLNGNMRTNGTRIFDYDDENQLIRITEPSSWKSEFLYDGKLRRRVRVEFGWTSGAWVTNQIVRYIYDGNLVIQERDQQNVPQVTYTRGRDLRGSLEGAGGIGGLLALSLVGTVTPQHFYYHADGNGNVTALLNGAQRVVARYLYDPFGNTLSASGPMAETNSYRFSSKELHAGSGLIYYLYRFYDPNLQRWPNRDPIGESGGFNLFAFSHNNPIDLYDTDGRVVPLVAGGAVVVVGDIVIIVSIGCLLSPSCRDAVGRALQEGAKALCNPRPKPKKPDKCDYYLAWCKFGNSEGYRPPDDPEKYWTANAPCDECYDECKRTGTWPVGKCKIGASKWDPDKYDPVWPPKKYR
jgi:RHS repeat-associated protein